MYFKGVTCTRVVAAAEKEYTSATGMKSSITLEIINGCVFGVDTRLFKR